MSWCLSSMLALHCSTQHVARAADESLADKFEHAAEGLAVEIAIEVAQKSSSCTAAPG